jgi:hypothetical protein
VHYVTLSPPGEKCGLGYCWRLRFLPKPGLIRYTALAECVSTRTQNPGVAGALPSGPDRARTDSIGAAPGNSARPGDPVPMASGSQASQCVRVVAASVSAYRYTGRRARVRLASSYTRGTQTQRRRNEHGDRTDAVVIFFIHSCLLDTNAFCALKFTADLS